MKVTYICDYCEEIVEEIEIQEEIIEIELECLTGEERQDIMKMAQGRIYFPSICNECMRELSLDQDLSLFGEPKIH